MSAIQALSPAETMRRHPCFSDEAHDRVGRVHLPVAPRCNIQCRFCERRICANLTMQHPGWSERLLTPLQAVELVRGLVCDARNPGGSAVGGSAASLAARAHGRSAASLAAPADARPAFVVGVAGPGDPLANEETFAALAALHREFPSLVKCISTNGLLLEEKLPQLLAAGVSALTVTVNAPDGEVGQRIYAWVRHAGRTYRGREAAELLVACQWRGIRAALAAGLALKVNTVLIPGVNDQHVARLAARLRELGVGLMNIVPLIPSGAMKACRAPTCDELRRARLECEPAIPQFRRCEQCRADIVRLV